MTENGEPLLPGEREDFDTSILDELQDVLRGPVAAHDFISLLHEYRDISIYIDGLSPVGETSYAYNLMLSSQKTLKVMYHGHILSYLQEAGLDNVDAEGIFNSFGLSIGDEMQLGAIEGFDEDAAGLLLDIAAQRARDESAALNRIRHLPNDEFIDDEPLF